MNNKSFTLKFTGNATNKGSMRNDIDVSFESMNETFKLATDEGAFHGGKGTAPPPLALFTASLCGCVMTQIKAFGKKLKIEVNEIKIDASMEWEGEMVPKINNPQSCEILELPGIHGVVFQRFHPPQKINTIILEVETSHR